jgi:hypothetical protein
VPREYKKTGYYAIKKLNPNHWPAPLRQQYLDRIDELLALDFIDDVRHRGIVLMVAWYEALLGIIRQAIATTGALREDGKAADLLREMMRMDALLIKLYQVSNLTPFVSTRMLDYKPAEPTLADLLKGVGEADVEETPSDGPGTDGKKSVQDTPNNASTGDTGAFSNDSDAIPDTNQTNGGVGDAD